MNPIPLEELLLQNLQTPVSLVEGGLFVERSKLLLYAKPGMFKSLSAAQLTLNLATGTPWLGYQVQQRRTLYLEAEIGWFPLDQRVKQMTVTLNQVLGVKVPPRMAFFDSQFGVALDHKQSQLQLHAILKRLQIQVLILDPVYKIVSRSSDEWVIQQLVDFVDYLLQDLGIAVVLVHHSRKPRITQDGRLLDQGGSEARGPLLEQWSDTVLTLQGEPYNDRRWLVPQKTRHAKQIQKPIQIELNRTQLWFYRV